MPALITKRGKKRWKGVVTMDGERISEKLFEDSSKKCKLEAVLWEKSIREALLKQLINMEYLTVETWAEKYLDFVSSRFSNKTLNEKIVSFRIFSSHAAIDPQTHVEDITPGIVNDVLKAQAESVSGHAANKIRKNLSAAWTWGERYIDDFPRTQNPFAKVDRFPEIEQPRYVPPEADFWTLMDYVKSQPGIASEQDKVILITCLHCAGRRGEIWRLKFSDLDFPNSRIRLWTRKRKHGNYQADWLPMTEELHDSMKQWVMKRMEMDTPDKQHVFVCLEKQHFCVNYYGLPFTTRGNYMKKICKRAGVEPFGFHAIRHLTASILFRKGHKLATIQAILRHESKTTTEKYLRSLGIDEVRIDLEEALKQPGKVIDFHGIRKAV